MTLWMNEIVQIKVAMIDIHLISLKAKYELADKFKDMDMDPIWEVEAILIQHQIEALQLERDDLINRI